MEPRAATDRASESQLAKHAARRTAFRRLHESGCFVIPNPWDAGSARYLRHLGFQALATSSAAFAFSQGLPDGQQVTLDSMLSHIADIVAATDLPVNADFEAGYARDAEGVAANVRRCVETGVAGLSIEDATGDPHRPLYEIGVAVERIKAARRAIDASGADVMLVGRAECFLVGHSDAKRESILRLEAYANAGADVLYAPGASKREDIEAIVKACSPKPVNVLVGSSAGMNVAELAALGVRRISVGGALARAAWTGFMRAAKQIAEQGSMAGFEGSVTHSELNELFRAEQ